MPNPKGNPDTLNPYKPKWRSGKTKTFRFPIALADNINEAARELDKNGNVSLLQVIKGLQEENKRPQKTNGNSSTVTGDRKEMQEAFEDAIAIPSNRGGQIKKAIANIGSLLGFELKKTSKGWLISDTRE